jgi:hypothetical protein
VLELVSFARAQRGGMPADFGYAINPWVRDVYAAAGERRVIEVKEAINFALGVRGYSLWGYDPIVSGRYTALIAASQGRDGSTLDNIDGEPPRHYHPVLAMLRADVELRFAEKRGVEMPRGLPNFWLVDRVQVVSDVDSAMNSVMDEAFDPSALVVLEASPQPLPVPPVTAEIEVLDVGTDHVDLRIDTERAAVLVVGDAYASGWRAVSLPGSAAGEYRVEPANVALRSVALGPGHHRLRLEYRPAYANIALAVSGAGTALFASGLSVWALRRSRAA